MVSIQLRLLRNIANSAGVRKYASNTAWLLCEQLLRGVVGVVIGIYVTRSLGPTAFGAYSYVIALVAIFTTSGRLGLDNLAVRELVRYPEKTSFILGTAFWLMLGAGAAFYAMLILTFSFSQSSDGYSTFVAIAGLMLLFQPFIVIDSYFQSIVRVRAVAVCRISALVSSNAAKFWCAYKHSPLVIFFVIATFEQAVLAFAYCYVGRVNKVPRFITSFSFERARFLLSESWPLMITALAVVLYMKMDQMIIKQILGEREVGVYSAAVRIYELWIAMPYLLTVSLMPAIVRAKSADSDLYRNRLIYLFRFVFWGSAAVVGAVCIFARPIIEISYGASFSGAATVLAVVMWTAVWSAMGSVSARYFVIEGMQRKVAVRTVIAAAINLVLNLALIPRIGILGAAVATLISTFISNYAMDWFDQDAKELLKIKHAAILGRNI
jgi:O-antigen/teichoic acid export membrane protein